MRFIAKHNAVQKVAEADMKMLKGKENYRSNEI